MFTVHYYNQTGEHLLDIRNILPDQAEFFRKNDIKVSMEEINGAIIVYGCPYSDKTEESEVIVFANGMTCEQTMTKLMSECKLKFGINDSSQNRKEIKSKLGYSRIGQGNV